MGAEERIDRLESYVHARDVSGERKLWAFSFLSPHFKEEEEPMRLLVALLAVPQPQQQQQVFRGRVQELAPGRRRPLL